MWRWRGLSEPWLSVTRATEVCSDIRSKGQLSARGRYDFTMSQAGCSSVSRFMRSASAERLARLSMVVESGRSEAAAGRQKVHTPTIGNGGHMLEGNMESAFPTGR